MTHVILQPLSSSIQRSNQSVKPASPPKSRYVRTDVQFTAPIYCISDVVLILFEPSSNQGKEACAPSIAPICCCSHIMHIFACLKAG